MTENPDSLVSPLRLACPESWPAKIGCSAWGADYGFHGCKFDPGHDGPHRCKCGRPAPENTAGPRWTQEDIDRASDRLAEIRKAVKVLPPTPENTA